MEHLNEFELEVLENLPVEPTGLSLTELADGPATSNAHRQRGRQPDHRARVRRLGQGR